MRHIGAIKHARDINRTARGLATKQARVGSSVEREGKLCSHSQLLLECLCYGTRVEVFVGGWPADNYVSCSGIAVSPPS